MAAVAKTVRHAMGINPKNVVYYEENTNRYAEHIELDTGVILFVNETWNSDINVRLGTVTTANVLTWGAKQTLVGTYTLEDFVKLSTTKALMVMRESGGNVSTVVISYTAPSTVTIGTPVNSSCDAVAGSIRGTLLTTDKVVIGYKDTSDSYPYAVVCSISGTTPSYGTPANAKAAAVTNADSISVATVSTSLFLITYDNGTNSYAHIMSVADATITANTESAFNNEITRGVSCCVLSSTLIAVGGKRISNIPFVTFGTISGAAISSWSALEGVGSAASSMVRSRLTTFSATSFIYGHCSTSNDSYVSFISVYPDLSVNVVSMAASGSAGSYSPSSVKKVDSTTFSYITLASRIQYVRCHLLQTSTPYGSNFVVSDFVESILTVATGKQVELSLLLFDGGFGTIDLYVNSTKPTAKVMQFRRMSYDNAGSTGYHNDYQKDSYQGIRRLGNDPLVLNAGDTLYAYSDINYGMLTVSGIERDV